jgi:hypothetical protein
MQSANDDVSWKSPSAGELDAPLSVPRHGPMQKKNQPRISPIARIESCQ